LPLNQIFIFFFLTVKYEYILYNKKNFIYFKKEIIDYSSEISQLKKSETYINELDKKHLLQI